MKYKITIGKLKSNHSDTYDSYEDIYEQILEKDHLELMPIVTAFNQEPPIIEDTLLPKEKS